jgi:hypothetical protein
VPRAFNERALTPPNPGALGLHLRDGLRQALEPIGWKVMEAENGQTAEGA